MTHRQDDLYVRYMSAFSASRTHTSDCERCQNSQDCIVGTPLHERFARLQDAYNTQQSRQPRR
ncbi:hypothetical protein [Streptomyces sp. NPDC059122]|uniref:hypothetical protein n=1 Tax=Streptomyces sp. NPDC059122 TaxID=3346732 RepID=UPI0036AE8023